jgi:hypothetical protein
MTEERSAKPFTIGSPSWDVATFGMPPSTDAIYLYTLDPNHSCTIFWIFGKQAARNSASILKHL